jgi:mannitol/fructose-specific phosphotransferase system IIA component (Ntr-type)
MQRLSVTLSDLLRAERVRIPLEGRSKDELLRELVDAVAVGNGADREEMLRAVREREAVLSTGIGHGVAIPHGKSAAIPELRLAAGRASEPVDFDALDGEPVVLLFLLVGPESAAGAHIRVLSRISRLVRQDAVRERLIRAGDAEEFLRILREADQ